MPNITLQDIFRASRTIGSIACPTPLIKSATLGERVGANIFLKLETLQQTGAFKVRGAANKILNLSAAEQQRGVVTVSTGNHGRAVAFVASRLGLNAAVCISERVPQNKVTALQQLKAEVVIRGQSQDEAEVEARRIQQERGATLIPPFDDADIVAGQGTIGLELLAELPQVDTVLAPLSGGGLIAGIALALKAANPAIRVVGVSMERAPAMYLSLQAGKPVQVPEEETLADSLQGGIGLDNRHTFDIVRRTVDDIVLLSEAEIADGMRTAFFEEHLVLEGAGAVGIAALLHQKIARLGQNVAVVLSGGNVDMNTFLQVVHPGAD